MAGPRSTESREVGPSPNEGEVPLTRGFLFCDLRGYTTFVEANGDRAGADLLAVYRGAVRSAIARTGGGEIRTEGDSFYVVFGSASAAVRCGLAIVESAATISTTAPDRPIRVGVGIHAGESVEGPEGYVGSAVNIAARVCARAGAGEVLVTDTVRSLVRTSLDVTFRPRGRPTLKGIAEPIALFAVRPTGSGPIPAAVRPHRRRRGALVGIGTLVVTGGATVLLLAVASSAGHPGSGPPGSAGPSAPAAGSSLAGPISAPSSPTTGPSIANAAPSASAAAGPPGRLAFVASQPVGTAIHQRAYVVDAAGGPRRLLSALTEDVTGLAWAPEGGQLAFSVDHGSAPIVVDASDPSSRRSWPGRWQASESVAIGAKPVVYGIADFSWSPGGRLVVASYGTGTIGTVGTVETDSDRAGIYRLSKDGGSLSLVTRPDAGSRRQGLYDDEPVVSPDGTTVAFRRAGPGSTAGAESFDLWVADLGGGGVAQVTEEIDAFSPAWSPDGTRIAFSGQRRGGGSIDIWVVGASGSGMTRLTADDATDRSPTWSPDGRWIAWSRTVGAQRQLWVMRSDGSDQHLLLAGEPGEQLDLPAWEPAG